MRQWYDLLRNTFGGPVGLVGGGDYDVRPITVTTYDSAHLHMEHLGARFGLLVFDEAHHLPGAAYALSARLSLAPFRLEADLASAVHPIPEAPRDLEGRLDDPRGTAVVLTRWAQHGHLPFRPASGATFTRLVVFSHRTSSSMMRMRSAWRLMTTMQLASSQSASLRSRL